MILELIVPGRGSLVSSALPSYKGHRYPVEVIAHAVLLYFRFPLSFREVEELMLERGVMVSYETVRRWCLKFGQAYAHGLRRRRPRPGDKWHLDEVFVKINGELTYLWRAVDADGAVLDILVQTGGTPLRPGASSANCSRRPARYRGWWSPTSCAPTAPPTEKSCPRSSTAPTKD